MMYFMLLNKMCKYLKSVVTTGLISGIWSKTHPKNFEKRELDVQKCYLISGFYENRLHPSIQVSRYPGFYVASLTKIIFTKKYEYNTY